MKIILKDGRRYMIRFDRNEEFIENLIHFCETEKIDTATFYAIGAVQEILISHYDIDTKKYSDKEIKEKLEIISLTGNVAKITEGGKDPSTGSGRDPSTGSGLRKTIIHAHASFSDSEMKLVGGHIKKMIVGPTCEVFLIKLEGKIEREFSDEIGLNLMK